MSDDIARWLIHVTVEIQKVERALCFRISVQLCKFENIRPSFQELILKNHKIYRKNYNNIANKIMILLIVLFVSSLLGSPLPIDKPFVIILIIVLGSKVLRYYFMRMKNR
jgi:uncharacterized protein YacL